MPENPFKVSCIQLFNKAKTGISQKEKINLGSQSPQKSSGLSD